jgi:hypothetical protein
MSTVDELVNFAKNIQESINCCLPARVTQVNEDGTVNVVAIRNDEIEDCVITVPVLRPETQGAYIQLAIRVGDRGVVKFCDKSIEAYRQGSEAYNGDDRTHSLSDGIFQLGFLPSTEKFIYPEGDIVIGLKDQTFTLSVTSGVLTIQAKEVTISSENTTINGNVQVNGTLTASDDVLGGGISLKEHTHTGNLGSPTSAPIGG